MKPRMRHQTPTKTIIQTKNNLLTHLVGSQPSRNIYPRNQGPKQKKQQIKVYFFMVAFLQR